MAPVKLYYFDARGICEPIRLILTYGGIEFEDIRAPIEKFPPSVPADIKSKTHWGQVPVAEFDGKSLCQSLAITRYFARKANLIPRDPYEAAVCDEYVDAIRDMMPLVFGVIMTTDPAEKEKKLDEALNTIKTRFLNVLEAAINASGGKHLVGDSDTLTWADFYLAYAVDHFTLLLGKDLTEGYPNIKNVKDTVFNLPKVKDWLEKRPVTKL